MFLYQTSDGKYMYIRSIAGFYKIPSHKTQKCQVFNFSSSQAVTTKLNYTNGARHEKSKLKSNRTESR